MADSLLFAVTDNLAQQAFITAKARDVHTICFCGSFVEDNAKLRAIITDKVKAASFYLDVSSAAGGVRSIRPAGAGALWNKAGCRCTVRTKWGGDTRNICLTQGGRPIKTL